LTEICQRIEKRGVVDHHIRTLAAAVNLFPEAALSTRRDCNNRSRALVETADPVQKAVKRNVGVALGKAMLDDSVADLNSLRLSGWKGGADQLHIAVTAELLVEVVIPKLATAFRREESREEIENGDFHGSALQYEVRNRPP